MTGAEAPPRAVPGRADREPRASRFERPGACAPSPRPPLLPIALLVLACAGPDPGGLAIVERDSAGVTIVENPPLEEAADFARVGPVPRLEIRMFEAMPRRVTYPAYSEVQADAAGRIWLADTRPPGVERRTWTVFGPDGHMLGRSRTPDGLRVVEIGEDYVLGVSRDELEVERVRLHGLEPAEPGEPIDG